MRQQSLEASGYEKFRKKTRKELFLEEMNGIIPWKEICEAIEPYYPKPKGVQKTHWPGAYAPHPFYSALV